MKKFTDKQLEGPYDSEGNEIRTILDIYEPPEGGWTCVECVEEELEPENDGLSDCGGCGAVIGESTDYPWHYAEEDCRALHDPISPLSNV